MTGTYKSYYGISVYEKKTTTEHNPYRSFWSEPIAISTYQSVCLTREVSLTTDKQGLPDQNPIFLLKGTGYMLKGTG